jgi:hypothetical protein
VKAGDLERNLSHLVEVTKAARACLASVEGEVSALKLALDVHPLALDRTEAPSSGVERPAGGLSLEAVCK